MHKHIDKYLSMVHNIARWSITVEETIMELTNAEIAKVFKALCDENRIQILRFLGKSEKCACQLLEKLNLTQPTLSYHMKILCDSGIVTGRKEGKWIYYQLSPQANETLVRIVNELL